MLKIQKQIGYLYTSSVLENLTLTGAWVAILSSRGFSLVEISVAETVFHLVSLLLELPSGILADVFGRKRMLIVSAMLRMTANVAMFLSGGLSTVCISMGLTAASYNFASGTGDALAYDSLKCAGQEGRFDRYESNQLTIYRLCGGLSTLCAGLALTLGYKIAYASSLVTGLMQILALSGLQEVQLQKFQEDSTLVQRLRLCAKESLCFLKTGARALLLMLANSLVGAMDTLLLFFLQAKLPERGIPQWALGLALLVMALGGVVGSRLILVASRWRFRRVLAAAAAAVLLGILLEHAPMYPLMVLGGFLSAAADDALQVRTNTLLQGMFPSRQRATLTSVDSFTFSVVMVVLTPLAGILFTIGKRHRSRNRFVPANRRGG